MQAVIYQDLGQIAYKTAWDYQESLLKENTELKLAAGQVENPEEVATKHYLLLCEHNHVYTLGKSGSRENLLISDEERAVRGIDFYPINRGGDITYHGIGQITGYPIFDLEKIKPDIGWYVRMLEEVFIRLIAKYGLKGERVAGESGVWLHTDSEKPLKILAIGVRCSRWVTMHGFAFNVNTDLSYFDHIIPCGLEGKGATSLEKELGRKFDIQEIKAEILTYFAEVFELRFLN